LYFRDSTSLLTTFEGKLGEYGGFCRIVAEVSILLGFDTGSTSNWILTFLGLTKPSK
jgi:hypothetical protein